MALEFIHAFGTNSKIKRNVTFYNDSTVAFIAGRLCILCDLQTLSQRLLHITESNEISAISRCFNHLALAIIGKPASVCLYNFESDTKKLYYGPKSMESDSLICISVSQSLKFVAGSGSEPDWLIVLWLFQTRQIVATFRPTASKPSSSISDLSFHAGGREEVAVVGKEILRIYECQEEEENPEEFNFSEVIFEKFENEEYTSITWTQKENLAVSTVSGKIYFFRGIEMVKEIFVADSLKEVLSTSSNSVTCLSASPAELFCVLGENVVIAFKGEEISQYKFSRMLLLPKKEDVSFLPGVFSFKHGTVNHLEVSSSNEYAVLSTDLGEVAYLNCNETDEKCFKLLLPPSHTGPILALSCARGKPLTATCSKNVFNLWNYESTNQELYVMFKDEIISMALHPTGLYVAFGFTFHIRICTIICSGLKDKKTLPYKNCSKMSFSKAGQYLVLANDFNMEVYSFATFSLLAKLKGHAGLVTSIVWKEIDSKMVSCDTRGVICEWDCATWHKIWTNTALFSYSSITVTPNNNFIITVCEEKVIRCLHEGLVIWESKCRKELTAITTDLNGEELCCGIVDGNIGKLKSVEPKALSEETYAHNGKIVDIMFNCDYTYFFSVGTDGLLMSWKGTNENYSPMKYIFADVNFLSNSDLEEQEKKLKLFNMSIQENEINYEYECMHNQLKYEENRKNMILRHELKVKELNQIIFDLSKKKQSLVLDRDISQPLKDIEDELMTKVVNYVEELDAVYKKTGECAFDNMEIKAKHEDKLRTLEGSFANTWFDNAEREEAILAEIKEAESTLSELKKITQNKKQDCKDFEKKADAKAKSKLDSEKKEKAAIFKSEQNKVREMQREARRLNNILTFVQEDNQRKRETFGQIESNIEAKTKYFHALKEEFKTFKSELKMKGNELQNVEAIFHRLRTDIEKRTRSNSISKSAREQVKSSIATAEQEILSTKNKIKDTMDSSEKLEADIKVAEGQHSILNGKLKHSEERLTKKRDLIAHNKNILSKYKRLLGESKSLDCDAEKLKQDILKVLGQYKSQTDESIDLNLKSEFDHQIKILHDAYEEIKKQPEKTMKDLATSNARLAQQNSKVLKEVKELQKEDEQLRNVISKMERSMGLLYSQKSKPTKEMQELRDRIELVISSSTRDRIKYDTEVAKLDRIIEEQQSELARLQKLMLEKEKSKIDDAKLGRIEENTLKKSQEVGSDALKKSQIQLLEKEMNDTEEESNSFNGDEDENH